jgi:hypothetical protein
MKQKNPKNRDMPNISAGVWRLVSTNLVGIRNFQDMRVNTSDVKVVIGQPDVGPIYFNVPLDRVYTERDIER